MKSKWSGILILCAGVILGLISGILLGSYYTLKATKTATNLASLNQRAWEAEQSMNAYLNGKPEIATYALNHFISVLKPFYDNKYKDDFPEATAQDLAFAYIRLGNISKIEKRSNEAEEFYEKGYGVYRQYRIDSAKEVPSREQLIDLINKLDTQTKSKRH